MLPLIAPICDRVTSNSCTLTSRNFLPLNLDEERSASARRPAGELSNGDVSSNVSNQQEATVQTSSWYLKLAIAKRCRLNKSIRQRFAFALKIQQMACAIIKNQHIATISCCKIPTGALLKDNQQVLYNDIKTVSLE
ncbi:hypothetical protein F511_22888 [Dorcoceras hygrometricum]|uniref:Uncharacterized protein n=1 Tax=Dorcoceras hygrometricum TaxID=472368 RepID=A0A2Z7BWI0_9LAMI|nr:hypothetical protein F511_22888 [Dorcoceras hygrometricum]